MDEVLKTIALLITAVFWGGVVVVDFIVTPARFRTPGVERAAILAIGAQIFRIFGIAQVGLGVLLMLVLIAAGGNQDVILPALFLLILAVLSTGMEPLMAALRDATNSPDAEAGEESGSNASFRALHQAYMVSDIFKVVLGVILIAALVAA
jgi:hypothetical protein